MKVVCLGAGNVATHLIKGLYDKSFDIIQVYSRTQESASALAKEVDAVPVTDLKDIIDDADLYIFALKDSVLEGVASQIPSNNGLWIHTAGSVPMDVFSNYTTHYGVLYPFQTFSKSRPIDWKAVPVFTEGSDTKSHITIRSIASQLSEKVFDLSSGNRQYLHLTGVFACNFTNHMYALSEQFLKKAGLTFDVVLPLIDETAAKVHTLSPEEAQTGPAVRFDERIINHHLHLIEDEDVKRLYKLISEDIHKSNK
ncbi:putative short-subunit dehydrogenase-like oxidoreductase (DUF2520 family) [Dysgonomonas hofstadii]|uniref:Putative short-subunit dehydrogenase-like oxidoreductase (DUF2520 family) n=1 Tax=Dysgonomonas hofstadii TaxID=637886 RepID=A0A840CYD7_9BACT|nr:DUF2520 domain-containing protein [Dysgonomonas hofstadii]MBB4036943.1 putative short-subunit dehydrogenase-like oxidoreductase (DUF2520 family) [Dysgonomonas hofstadii]